MHEVVLLPKSMAGSSFKLAVLGGLLNGLLKGEPYMAWHQA
jgi:hypothetical protein